jgi:Resolvase, N terminal domain
VLQRFADAEGIELVDVLVEVESAKHDASKRPVLAQALARAKRGKLPIVVAKLDRLSRDVHYISGSSGKPVLPRAKGGQCLQLAHKVAPTVFAESRRPYSRSPGRPLARA